MIFVDDLKHYESAPPIEQMLTLVFAEAARIGVSEIRFDYYPDGSTGLWWCLAGDMQELEPPPGSIGSRLMHVLLSGAVLDPARLPSVAQRVKFWMDFREECPAFGTYPIRFGGVAISWDFVYFRGREGEHICLTKTTPLNLAYPAEWFFEQWRGAGKTDFPSVSFQPKPNDESPG